MKTETWGGKYSARCSVDWPMAVAGLIFASAYFGGEGEVAIFPKDANAGPVFVSTNIN